MFANKKSKRLQIVSIVLFLTIVAWSIIKSNLTHAGSVQVDIRLSRIAEVNVTASKAITQATADLIECPAPVKLSEVRGKIRNCAQGKNSYATVEVGNKTIVHGKNDVKR